jgi:hypothetical protein
MSDAMAWCGAVYLVGAVLLLAAMVVTPHGFSTRWRS